MRLSGEFKFMGVESRPGFKDPSKINYVLGLSQGLDTIRLYIDAVAYAQYCKIDPYTDVVADLDYNPVANSVGYCMRLLDLRVQ